VALTRGRVTLNEIEILELDVNPNFGSGAPAPVGSLAIVDSTKSFWLKTNSSDLGWELQFDPNVNNAQKITFNPNSTPNFSEWFSDTAMTPSKRVARTDFNFDVNLNLTSDVMKLYHIDGTTVIITITTTYFYVGSDIEHMERVFS
jgi:hypothetical protein